MKKNGFSRDFTLVVIGQIISLFGNAVVRFALPLHLLNISQSPALYGLVSALAFLPLLIMSPLGGVIADRVNKRNIMVVLDFTTAGIILLFLLLSRQVNLVTLILVTLILLFSISGLYQPSVQASMPFLVPEEKLVQANAMINTVVFPGRSAGTCAGRHFLQYEGDSCGACNQHGLFFPLRCDGDLHQNPLCEKGDRQGRIPHYLRRPEGECAFYCQEPESDRQSYGHYCVCKLIHLVPADHRASGSLYTGAGISGG